MKAKKSLGQNFLKSEKAVKKMVEISGARKGDLILEIGPGLGVLTASLLAVGANVTAVEKDDALAPILAEKFEKEIAGGQLKLIGGDILEFDLEIKNYKVVANIPYYITGQIIRKFLSAKNQPASVTLLLQKEVAERIVSRDGKESLLSLSVKAYGEPKLVEKVPRGAFSPAPSVDSAIVHISNISRKNFEKNFFALIHAGFAHKRKQILPNLAEKFEKEKVIQALKKANISPKARAEDIPLSKWLELGKILD